MVTQLVSLLKDTSLGYVVAFTELLFRAQVLASYNRLLVQTFLVAYLVSTVMLDRSVPTDALLIGSAVGFITVPVVALLGDRFGRRPLYTAFTVATGVLAFPLVYLITNGSTVAVTIAMVLALNIGVLALFSLESVTMAELFGSRTRFTQLALAKEIGGILTTAIGPVLAATLTAATGSWWPIAAMMVAYSAVALVAARLAPETRGRDLVAPQDAA